MTEYQAGRLSIAAELERKGNWSRLLDYCKEWSIAEPTNYMAWQGIGDALTNVGKVREAIAAYERGLQVAPKTLTKMAGAIFSASSLWYRIGNSFNQLGNYVKAVEAFEQASEIDGKSAEIWNNLGIAYINTKQAARAFEAFTAALNIDPENVRVLRNLGEMYLLANRRDGAEAIYKRLININREAAIQFKDEMTSRLKD